MAKKPDCSELAKVITKLALNIAQRPGITTLDQVTDELRKHLPEISRQEVVDAIVEATTGAREAMDETRKRIADLKREARTDKALRDRIAELEKIVAAGSTAPEGGPRPDRATEAVKKLREIAGALRQMARPATSKPPPSALTQRAKAAAAAERAEARTVEALTEDIETLERHLRDGTLPEKGPRTPKAVSDEVARLRELRAQRQREVRQSIPAQRERLAEQIDRLARRLEAHEGVPTIARADLPVSKELERMAYERDKLRRRWREYRASLRPRSFWSKYPGEVLNLSRSVLTSMDFSAVLRQGGFIALGNPARAARSLGPMFRAFRSDQKARDVMAEIENRPNAPLYARAKLSLTQLDGSLTKQEEAFMSRLAGKIPLVAGTQRAYTVFLNKLRADTFDAMVETLTRNGEATLDEAKAIANYVNVATGRANLGQKWEQAAQPLAQVFFAPRYVVSRFQLLAGQPAHGGTMRTRRLVAQEYGKFLAGIGVVLALGALAGAEIEDDPRSTDFLKLRFGGTRIDPWAGLQQVAVLGGRMLSGETKDKRGRIREASRASLIGRFVRTKLAPLPGTALDVAEGENVVGDPVTPLGAAGSLFVPLSFREIAKVMEEHGVAEGTAIGLLNLFGMGVQHYD